ncbi:E3 ubiquitin-protein ligase CIP8-like [Carica papaya]|uniref:E3 ubiquitin-protein ligase CIP8-like n=1 Tax=Carica papaya TaxID=3649 RepID=UPI000B8CD44F|nr:E3 ubiquitin-protein ligase CIP8-like [Carica papaya]
MMSQSDAVFKSILEQGFDLDEALWMPRTGAEEADNSGHDEAEITSFSSSVANLPTVYEISSGGACTVCMERVDSGVSAKKIPCGHVYHASCIATWLSHCNSCPLCRRQIIISAAGK